MNFEGSLRDDGNLHCPERRELSGQVQHHGGAAAPLAQALQVTGIDNFLASQSKRFFAIGGRGAAAFSWVPVTVAGQPAQGT
jgi:hypothetical protein